MRRGPVPAELNPEPDRGGRASFSEAFGFGALSFVSGAVLGLGSSIAIARLYGIDVIGGFALASAPTGIAWFLSTVRERPALIRELAKLPPRHDRVTGLFMAVFLFSFALTAVVCAIATLATYLLFNGAIGQPDLFLPAVANLVVYLLVVNTCWNLDGVFSAFLAGRQLFWIRTQQALVYLLGAIVAVLVAEPSVWGLTIATSVSYVLTLIYRLVAVRRWMRLTAPTAEIRAGFHTLPEILWFGIKVTPGSLATGLSTEAGTWILGIFGSVASVGAWNRAWMLGKRLVDLNYRMSEMLLPALVERDVQGDRVGFDRAFLDSLRYMSMVLLLPAAAAGGASVGLMNLFGPGFSQASTALQLTLLATPLTVMVVLETQTLLAVDRPLVSSWFSVLRLVLTIGASVPLTIALGVTGPALGVLAGCAAQFVAQLVYLRRFLDGPIARFWPKRSMFAVAIAYVAGFGASRALDSSLSGILGLGAALLAGSVVYCVCLLLVGGVPERDRRRFEQGIARLRRALKGGQGGPSVSVEEPLERSLA
jgi:O-antigen/teichoic acid export membrane protein